ncbi:MAG: DEAD/DEAH box helicase [Deltaproteobacteria bacterium]|nr:DEAD/DEAH box helicase [Deltaproteobacteria bacterium]
MKRPPKGRPRRRAPSKGRPRPCDRPGIDPRLKSVFKRIGVPAPGPFVPDPFQLDALERVRGHDVLVSAPTGAGKTWIAVEAIRRLLAEGMRVWYASPLKALSNTLYRQFKREFEPSMCGILTGDRKENPQAPVIVGTTEILRNQLYDAMHRGASIATDLVILDEAHYLSDPDRGVVWEEVLIYLPSRVRLLLLSATIPNADELAAWLQENPRVPADVVRHEERPVPLEMLFLSPDGSISHLGGRKGLSSRVRKSLRERATPPPYSEVVRCLRKLDLLPAIFFLKSRADCDRAVRVCSASGPAPGKRERARAEVSAFLSKHPHLKGNRQLRSLQEGLAGAHHAGQLPAWKLLVEQMMDKGVLEAIFSTSTVAAGVNFPARTVVLVQSDRFDGQSFQDLTARELHQMIGRAGRRGKDRIGFAVVLPGPYQDPELLLALKDALPEPLESRIHINFSMTLNLLLSHSPDEVHALLERSFAAFQRGRLDEESRRRWESLNRDLAGELSGGRCDTNDPFEVLEYIAGREELTKSLRRQKREQRRRAARRAYEEYLEPGRLFLHKKGGIYMAFGCFEEDGDLICEALNVQGPIRTRGNRIRLRRVRLDRIELLFDRRLDIPADPTPRALSRLLDEVRPEELEIMRVEPSSGQGGAEDALQDRMESLPCDLCPRFKDCHTPKNRRLKRILQEIRAMLSRVEGMGEGLWLSFKRHLRFLKETGFVDERDRLTPDGEWASKLRLDHPLLIAEGIRKGAFGGTGPEVLAGIIAPFVWDRDLDVAVRAPEERSTEPLERAWERVADAIEKIRAAKTVRGFPNPRILSWPAVALYLWAGGSSWEDLLFAVPVDEGDMVSLVTRTADHLRQVAGLEESHPDLAACADEAVSVILREPISF